MFAQIRHGPPAHRSHSGSESLEVVDLQCRLEFDLERLQGLLDASVGEMRSAFERIDDAMESFIAAGPIGAPVREDIHCAIACLRFHDIASQLITDLRDRVALLQAVTANGQDASTGLCGASVPASEGDKAGAIGRIL